jgi:hypothetical protein
MSRVERLAEALLADRDRPDIDRGDITACFSCGHAFLYRGRRDDLNGRFCSTRCQAWHDAGNSRYRDQAGYRDGNGVAMKPGRHGFYIRCAGCQKEFESLGLRCCSIECDRRHRERRDNLAIMAEVGMETAAKRFCAGGCGVKIPTWRKGRRVSSNTRFCSPKCAQKARDGAKAEKRIFPAETVKIPA